MRTDGRSDTFLIDSYTIPTSSTIGRIVTHFVNQQKIAGWVSSKPAMVGQNKVGVNKMSLRNFGEYLKEVANSSQDCSTMTEQSGDTAFLMC